MGNIDALNADKIHKSIYELDFAYTELKTTFKGLLKSTSRLTA